MIPVLLGDWVLRFVVGAIALLVLASLVLAAVALRLRLRNARRAREWARLEALWTPVFLDVLANARTPEELHELIGPRDRLAFIGFLSRFSERLRGKEWTVLRGLALPYLPQVAASSERGDPERRARAIQTLGELGMPEYEHTVVAALDDESPLVAMVAARTLFRPGNEVHFREVFDRLSRYSLWSSRFLAAMFAAGGPDVAPMLRGVLDDPLRTDPERVAALDALRVLHDSISADRAIGILEQAVNRELRLSALRLLEVVGRKGHAAAVRPLLASEDSAVRRAAVGTMGALGDLSDAGALALLLDDPSPWVRVGAAEALSALGARDELLKAAAKEGRGGQVAREMVQG